MDLHVRAPTCPAELARLARLWTDDAPPVRVDGRTMLRIAIADDRVIEAAAAFRLYDDGCEIVCLRSATAGEHAAEVLLDALEGEARALGRTRIWLVARNDDIDGLRFYQRHGYRVTGVRPGALDDARRAFPELPAIGRHEIPLHDVLELEKRFAVCLAVPAEAALW